MSVHLLAIGYMIRVWINSPESSYNNMLPHLVGEMCTELWFVKRCIQFIDMHLKSYNNSQMYPSIYDGCEWLLFVLRC